MRDEPLLTTKLFVPPPRPDLVRRPRLERRLTASLHRKITLLAAPAGFGKTTLLSAWHDTLAGGAVPLAWVSLDIDDNDPVRFWTYVSIALDRLHPGTGKSLQAQLRAPNAPSGRAVADVLLSSLASLSQDIMLVLDDYQVIETQAIHDGLAALLDRMPPSLHLIIASRVDPPLPLARLRARGELLELRAADLRFTPDEAFAFLSEIWQLPLAVDDIAALTDRTEGWIAGLHLAALSIEGRDNPSDFVRGFAGSHRFLIDYLAEEVLSRQPPEVQHFLLHTAILDRLSGPLCDAVTERVDGQAMLEHLERGNLFTFPLDDVRRWYRYHQLFAEFLRARLARISPTEVAILHSRASNWHERAESFNDAVGHALAGNDTERVADLVEQVIDAMWLRGELSTLLGWLEALPRSIVRARPRLAIAHAGTHFLVRAYDARTVGVLLDEAETALEFAAGSDIERAELRGTLAAIGAAAADARHDTLHTIDLAREALAALPTDRIFWRAVTTVVLGMAYAANGDPAASRTLVQALTISQGAGNRSLAMVAMMNLAVRRAAEGMLGSAADLCRQGLAMAEEHAGAGLPVTVGLHVQLGQLWYEWNDLEAAARHIEAGLAGDRSADEQLSGRLRGYAALARIRQVEGDLSGAETLIKTCEHVARASQLPWTAQLASAFRARLELHRGDLVAATRWIRESELQSDDHPTPVNEFAYFTLARLLIARDEAADALSLLERLGQAATVAGRGASVLESLLLEALARQAIGEDDKAIALLESALMLAEPEGFIRLFVDEGAPLANLLARLRACDRQGDRPMTTGTRAYIDRILHACAPVRIGSGGVHARHAGTGPSVATLEPLTPRERDVLNLMADGLTNAEIAARLFVTVSTVKTYVNGIFGKLNATNRAQAIARARTSGLISD